MNFPYNTLISDLPIFESSIIDFLKKLQIQPGKYQIDHIGIRAKTDLDAQNLLDDLLERDSKIVSEIELKNRRILNIKLHEPIRFLNQNIEILELPFPVVGEECNSNIMWEHIEIVIPGVDLTIEGLEKSFFAEFPHLSQQVLSELGITYATRLPQTGGDQLPNPTIKLTDDKDLEVKFHLRSLAQVIGIESF